MAGAKVLVVGAGVIGRIYAARLAAAGNDVDLLARGRTLANLAGGALTLHTNGRSTTQQISLLEAPRAYYDTAFVTVRRDQIDAALDFVTHVRCDHVVPLCNNPLGIDTLRERIGAERLIAGFPGVGGYLNSDESVTYLQIRQQPTTLERRRGAERATAELLTGAGFTVAGTDHMADWLATHALFVTTVCAALDRANYDAPTLARDRAVMRDFVRATRSGFLALRRRGIAVAPAALVFLFTRTPTEFAARYWSRLLRGPLGTVALAPHARATRDTEIAALRTDVRLLLPSGAAPDLDTFVYAGSAVP
ncbi:ketopantoate reductase family protein [Nocardia sp. NPDC004123]